MILCCDLFLAQPLGYAKYSIIYNDQKNLLFSRNFVLCKIYEKKREKIIMKFQHFFKDNVLKTNFHIEM